MSNRAAVIPLSTVLNWARDRNLTGAVVVGRLPDGSIDVASTSGDQADCLALLQAAAARVRNPQPVDKRETVAAPAA